MAAWFLTRPHLTTLGSQFKSLFYFAENPVPQNSTIAQAAAATNRNPSQAQIEAGNYAKGRCLIHQLRVAIENPKGSTRRGTDKSGKSWSVTMKNHYGYFTDYEGRDGDPLDVFIGPDAQATHVFVVNQIDPDTGKFDEHKVMCYFPSEEWARRAYLSNYAAGWKGLGSVRSLTVVQFKKWLSSGDLTKRAASFFIA